VREYTPIKTTEGDDDEDITIIVRLVPKGTFSTLLKSFLKDGQTTYLDCSIACNVYGPLHPLQARFGYVPFYGCDNCNNLLPHPDQSSTCLCSCPNLLLVCIHIYIYMHIYIYKYVCI
jgi:hypothetical protein